MENMTEAKEKKLKELKAKLEKLKIRHPEVSAETEAALELIDIMLLADNIESGIRF